MKMRIEQLLYTDKNERPLEYIPADGGFCGIFRTIACVGDSLSSGEFEGTNEKNEQTYHDMFEYSWGQYLARAVGCTAYNFSRGGMTAGEYCESFAEMNNFWSPVKAAQAYIIALGVNDLMNLGQEPGSVEDICDDDPERNAATFTGYYAKIIQKYKKIQPDAKFFLVTVPDWFIGTEEHRKAVEKHAQLMHEIAAHFTNTYVVDLYRDLPPKDEQFHRRFKLGGHLNPMGYILQARLIAAYIDYIIRHNMEDFRQVGFIGTPFHNTADQ